MRFTLFLLLVLGHHLAAQSGLSSYKWEHFHPFLPANDVVETPDAIWWATNLYFIRYDKSSEELKVGVNDSPIHKLGNNQKFWLSPEGRLHIYDREGLVVYQDDTWAYHKIPDGYPQYRFNKLLYQDEEGGYYFLGSSFSMFRWQPGMPPEAAPEITNVAPWFIMESTWEPTARRLWVTDRVQLGYISDGDFTAVELPGSAGFLRHLHTAPDGAIWVQFDDQVLRRTDNGWLSFPFPEQMRYESVQLRLNGRNQAMLSSASTTLLLELQGEAFTVTDWTTPLSEKSSASPLLLDKWGEVWWIDAEKYALGNFAGEGSIRWQQSSSWYPGEAELQLMSMDTEGRPWITADHKTYFYSNKSWWDAARLFPNFPDSARQILFTEDCAPIVLTTSEDFFTFSVDTRIHWYHQGRWIVLPVPEDSQSAPPFITEELHLDHNGNLWAHNVLQTSFAVWQGGKWEFILISDLFPTPSRLIDLVVDENNQQYIAADNGLFIRSGQSYQHFTYQELGASSGSNTNYRSIGMSPEQSVWITRHGDVIQVESDGTSSRLPLLDTDGSALPNYGVVDIHPYDNEDIWTTYFTLGVAHYNGQGWTRFTINNSGLHANNIHWLEKDPQQRIWFGYPDGISVLTPSDLDVVFPGPEDDSDMIVAPNPACCHVQISWQQTTQERVQVWLADAQGRILRSITDQILPPGPQNLMIQRDDLPAGVYFLIRQSGEILTTETIFWK